jgi:hypothetical protein
MAVLNRQKVIFSEEYWHRKSVIEVMQGVLRVMSLQPEANSAA